MKKRVDQLQAENQTLKSDLDRQRATVIKTMLFININQRCPSPRTMIPTFEKLRKINRLRQESSESQWETEAVLQTGRHRENPKNFQPGILLP
jgi:hypothetical protein